MLLVTEEAPPSISRVPNVLDVGMEPGTFFEKTPAENLLSVASVLLRDLELAGFVGDEVEAIAELLKRFAQASRGGRN